ncbi:ABC transporter permease [Paenibacillus sp. L3-i20]|uniref:ABC transporter permease n=1 Tax=Paenibacillus sp. L3-i20 TaxID=2905833 RepID=UPI001EDD03FA|nr:ABC transporter permease [Paenibacillus sp. L3-i20]GKU78930.1 putative transport permease YfiM [Paenibacillus sp. L3-i20]
MGAFLKKDLLIYWRDRKENIISLIITIILIVVLGLILPGWVENPASTLQLKAAYVVNDNETEGLNQFQVALAGGEIKEEAAASLSMLAEQKQPAKLLRELLTSDEVTEMINWTELKEDEALRQLEDGDIEAIVTIPEGFTRLALNKIILDEGDGAAISLVADNPSIEVNVLHGIIDSFTQQFNVSTAISYTLTKTGGIDKEITIPEVGGLEQIDGVRAITSFQYFTLAIAVLFAMYQAANTASKAVTEKREQVFQRILLSGSSPLSYLSGKLGVTLITALLTFTIVIVISNYTLNLFPNYSLKFWLGFLLLTAMMGLFVAAMSGLFTAIMFRINPDITIAIIQMLILVIGLIGGNFVPIYILPDVLKELWEWTPNGLWLSTMIQWIHQESWVTMAEGIFGLLIFTVVAIALSVWLFPKRGVI